MRTASHIYTQALKKEATRHRDHATGPRPRPKRRQCDAASPPVAPPPVVHPAGGRCTARHAPVIAPAGLLVGAFCRSSSSRLASRKWPRWLVLNKGGREEGRG